MPRAAHGSSIAIVLAATVLATARADDHQTTPARNGEGTAWLVPRTADGRPDLEGVWENNSATPLERPKQFADKPRLSDEELATLEYTFTVDNPTMWTTSWTATINWKRAQGELLEYACHEGNYSLPGMLAGARAGEAPGR